MTKKQILKDTLHRRKTDAVPYAINLTEEGYQAYGEQLIKEYADDQVKSDYKRGILTLPEAVSLGIGNYMLYVYAPWWDWYQLPKSFAGEDTPDELPQAIGHGSYETYFDKLRYLNENYDVYLLNAVWGSHWEKAYFCRGIENFLADLAGSPEWAQQVLDSIIKRNLVMLENILPNPDLDGVLLGSDWGTQQDLIFSPDCFRTMIRPGEQQEYDLIKKYHKDVFIHSCGNICRIMPDLVEMGIHGLNPVQPECMDLSLLKQQYGQSITYYGGISTQRTLPYGTPEEVSAETEYTIRLMGEGGGYITAPSQEIQTDVPYENLKALIDTAKRFG